MTTQNSSNQQYTNNSDGFSLSGGTTRRKLSIIGSDINFIGSAAVNITLPGSDSTLVATSAIDTDGTLAANSDTKLASQKATKTYADTKLAKSSNLSDVANAATARGNISAAQSGANGDITSLTGLTTPLSISQGGTGSASQNFVDLSTTQSIGGAKTFTGSAIVVDNGSGKAQFSGFAGGYLNLYKASSDTSQAITLSASNSSLNLGPGGSTATDTTLSRTSDAGISTSGIVRPINAQTGTTYTFVKADAGQYVTSSNASAQTLTIPANSSVAFAIGTLLITAQVGTGSLTVQGASGVTVNGTVAGSVNGTQYQPVIARKTATDTWIISTGASGSSLPSQTGNSGKYLTTNGTSASWSNVPTPSMRVNTLTAASNIYTINTDTTDLAIIGSPTANFTITTSGTPTDGQKVGLRIVNGSTAYTPTWNSIFASSPDYVLLPSFIANSTVNLGFTYSSALSQWVVSSNDSKTVGGNASAVSPAYNAMLGWTVDPMYATGNQTLTSGRVYLFKIMVPTNISVTNIVVGIGAVGSGLTAGQSFMGLYNSSGTLIGSTADQSTAFASAGMKTAALSGGPYTIAGGPNVFVWAAIVSNGTTPPKPTGSAPGIVGIVNIGLTAATYRSAYNGTATTSLPASITPSSNTTNSNMIIFMSIN